MRDLRDPRGVKLITAVLRIASRTVRGTRIVRTDRYRACTRRTT